MDFRQCSVNWSFLRLLITIERHSLWKSSQAWHNVYRFHFCPGTRTFAHSSFHSCFHSPCGDSCHSSFHTCCWRHSPAVGCRWMWRTSTLQHKALIFSAVLSRAHGTRNIAKYSSGLRFAVLECGEMNGEESHRGQLWTGHFAVPWFSGATYVRMFVIEIAVLSEARTVASPGTVGSCVT